MKSLLCKYNIKYNCFTHYNIACIIINIIIKYFNISNIYWINKLYSINVCWSWTIFTTIHCVIIFDNNAYIKVRKKINCGYFLFHFGNTILHDLPCVYIYYNPPQQILLIDGFYAYLLVLLWIIISTNGSMNLNNIYVNFNNKTKHSLYILSSISCLSIPLIYNY